MIALWRQPWIADASAAMAARHAKKFAEASATFARGVWEGTKLAVRSMQEVSGGMIFAVGLEMAALPSLGTAITRFALLQAGDAKGPCRDVAPLQKTLSRQLRL